ncbi:hypothetical protein [Metabacillus litoralis]|uniref:hypothetical protein n=1 Tax=Metabacillus TaxID=2675233 RepID=UPI001B8E587E|nr:hypothetical protein [Metabacillus litoralis]
MEPSKLDLCSHGEIYIKVNDYIITQDGLGEEWGIIESALALLRTVNNDYECDPENEEGLILHGCGTMLMTGCPISIHWSVKHLNDQVILSNFIKIKSTSLETGIIRFPVDEIVLSNQLYNEQIVSFALKAKSFFNQSKKQISDEYDQEMYLKFWEEYDSLLNNLLQ